MDRFDNVGARPKISHAEPNKNQNGTYGDLVNLEKRQQQFNYHEMDRFDNPGAKKVISHAEPVKQIRNIHVDIQPDKMGSGALKPETPKQTLAQKVTMLETNQADDKKGALYDVPPDKKLN